jgi:hypothetical protein
MVVYLFILKTYSEMFEADRGSNKVTPIAEYRYLCIRPTRQSKFVFLQGDVFFPDFVLLVLTAALTKHKSKVTMVQ